MFNLLNFFILVVVIVCALTVHEFAHAWVAHKLGDDTAKRAGRVSLNPIRHLDLVGSLVFLITQMIGWGKPVPVNLNNFKNPLRANALVAFAGPLSNFLFALVIAIFLKFFPAGLPVLVAGFLGALMNINIILGAFNLLPFPPLDGSKIIGIFVPRRFEGLYLKYLDDGFVYFLLFLMFDLFVLANILGGGVISFLVSKIVFVVRSLVLFGV
jgi:Zn-dependent protease